MNGREYSIWLIRIGWERRYSLANVDERINSSMIVVKIDDENNSLINVNLPEIKSVRISSYSFSCFRQLRTRK